MISAQPQHAFSSFRGRAAALAVALLALTLVGCTAMPAPSEPQAPDFSLPAADGRSVSLKDYVGKQPVLLYFHMAVG